MKTELVGNLRLSNRVFISGGSGESFDILSVAAEKFSNGVKIATVAEIGGPQWGLSAPYPELASKSEPGILKIGYPENGDNYPVRLSAGQAYVVVPSGRGPGISADNITIGVKDVSSVIYVKSIRTLSGDLDGLFATKEYVDDSVASSAATFRGTFTSQQLIPTEGVRLNDYAFVLSSDGSGNPVYVRYKYGQMDGIRKWLQEYVLNNSSFTAEQWTAINSKINEDTVNKLVLADDISVSYWNEAYEKQSGIAFGDLASRDLSSIVGENLEKYVDAGVEKLRALQPTASDLSDGLDDVFVKKGDLQLSVDELLSGTVKLDTDLSGNKTAVTIGRRNPYIDYPIGEGSFTQGNGCDATGKYGTVIGAWSKANGDYSTAVGVSDVADGANSIAFGYFSHAANNHSFVWQGGEDNEVKVYYESHGNGTFNINPLSGVAGVFIGEESLSGVISSAVKQNEKSPSEISAELGLSGYMKKSELSDFLVVTSELPANPDPEKFYFITK